MEEDTRKKGLKRPFSLTKLLIGCAIIINPSKTMHYRVDEQKRIRT